MNNDLRIKINYNFYILKNNASINSSTEVCTRMITSWACYLLLEMLRNWNICREKTAHVVKGVETAFLQHLKYHLELCICSEGPTWSDRPCVFFISCTFSFLCIVCHTLAFFQFPCGCQDLSCLGTLAHDNTCYLLCSSPKAFSRCSTLLCA